MPEPASITIVPLGTVDLPEVEAAAKRAAKALGLTLEIARPVPLPAGHSTPHGRNRWPRGRHRRPSTFVAPTIRAAPDDRRPQRARRRSRRPSRRAVHGPAVPSAPPAGRGRRERAAARESGPRRRACSRIAAFRLRPRGPRRETGHRLDAASQETFWKRKSIRPAVEAQLVRQIIGAIALALKRRAVRAQAARPRRRSRRSRSMQGRSPLPRVRSPRARRSAEAVTPGRAAALRSAP